METHTEPDKGLAKARETMSRHYLPELPDSVLTPDIVELFTKYSRLPQDCLQPHILQIRDKAWQLFPYLCTGRFTFVEFGIGKAPQYHDILRRIKHGEKYLDVGCFLGQDIRKLAYDGAPSSNLVGTDLEPAFFPLGYELFNDTASLQTPFVASDMLNPEDTALDHLTDTISIIHASSVFHLFGYEGQVARGLKCVKLLKKVPGSMIFGRQAGNLVAQETDHPRGDGKMYRHSEQTWREMWQKDIGGKTGTKWRVDVDMDAETPECLGDRRELGHRRVRFVCTVQ